MLMDKCHAQSRQRVTFPKYEAVHLENMSRSAIDMARHILHNDALIVNAQCMQRRENGNEIA